MLGETAEARARVRIWCAFDAAMHKEFRPLFYKHVVRPRLRRRFGSTTDFLAALPADLSEADAHWIRSVWDDTVRIDMNHDGAIAVLRQKLERLEAELHTRDFIAGTAHASFADLLLAAQVKSLVRMPIGLNALHLPFLSEWRGRVEKSLGVSSRVMPLEGPLPRSSRRYNIVPPAVQSRH